MLMSNMVVRVGARIAQTAGGIAVLAGLTLVAAPGAAAGLVVVGAAIAIAGAIVEDTKDGVVPQFATRVPGEPSALPPQNNAPVTNVRLASGNVGALKYSRFPANVTPPVLRADIRARLITCGLADAYGAIVWQYDGPPGFFWIPRLAPTPGLTGLPEYKQDASTPPGVLADGIDNAGNITGSTTLVAV